LANAGLVSGRRSPKRFADALIWNWVIGGTDAHAKKARLGPVLGRLLPRSIGRTPAS
jgi:hypothetical protein